MRRKRTICLILCVALIATLPLSVPATSYGAEPRPMTLRQAESLAFANSTQYQTKLFQYNRLCKSYQSALRSVATKWKDYGTIRWSFLFKIKWPEYPYMDEAMGLYMKGPGIMVQINGAVRELYDIQFQVKNKIDALYTGAYQVQVEIAYNEKQVADGKRALVANRAKLATGHANAKEVEAIESNLKKLEEKQVSLLRTYMIKMKAIKNMTGVDVTTGYRLTDPYVTMQIDRVKQLPDLITYALYWDLNVYHSDLDVSLDRYQVGMNMQLISRAYGGSTHRYVSPYVDKILRGEKVNVTSFSRDYERFLDEIDAPWRGNYKIWYIRIPKEWFKGKLSGIRYIENSQYAPMDDALTLQNDLLINKDVKNMLIESVESTYNSVMDANSAYLVACDAADEAKKNLESVMALNKLGQATYTETQDAQKALQDAELTKLDTLNAYTDLLYSLDRITYGGVSKLLRGESIQLNEGASGMSYADMTDSSKAYYYIQPMVQHQTFLFGLSIPKGFEPTIDSYEVWYGDYQIGKRTPIDQQIIHLAFDYAGTNQLAVRVYDGDRFVDQCEADANVPVGELNFKKALPPPEVMEKIVGTYQLNTTGNIQIAAAVISFQMKQMEHVAYYILVDSKGKPLIDGGMRKIDDPLAYLTLMASSMGSIKMKCFDENKEFLYSARFDEETFEIVAPIPR